jgi:hypothetical protein
VSPGGGTSSDAFAYYSNNVYQAELMGFATDDGTGNNLIFIYTDNRVIVTYPFTFGSTITDTYSAYVNLNIGGMPVTNYRWGTVTTTGDAWGSLTTPTGSYSNVLRIEQIESSTDSLNFLGTPSVSTSDVTTYSWSSPISVQSLMTMAFVTTTTSTSTTNSSSAQYSDFSSKVPEIKSAKPLAVYPNPSTNNSIVHLTADDLNAGATTFIATDVTGKEVKRIEFDLRAANRKTVDIDMSDCPNGIYLVRLEQKDAIFTSRFLKQ